MTRKMSRRKMLTATGAATAVALAGCAGDNPPRKQCLEGCNSLERWGFEWDGNGIGDSTLSVTFVPAEDTPPLEVEFRGYDDVGENAKLSYVSTYEVGGLQTFIEEQAPLVERAEIKVSEQ